MRDERDLPHGITSAVLIRLPHLVFVFGFLLIYVTRHIWNELAPNNNNLLN